MVGPGIKTGINILLEDPGATGADLIAAAVAAVDTYPTPLTVVDMGTATTIAVIDDGNAFLGGAVLPGLRISAEGPVQPGLPPAGHPAGTAPGGPLREEHCGVLQSGLMFGAAAMVDGLIDRMEAELGRPTTVVATGEWHGSWSPCAGMRSPWAGPPAEGAGPPVSKEPPSEGGGPDPR